MRPGTILDHQGNVAGYSTFAPITATLQKDRFTRGSNKGSLSTTDALPHGDRLKVISWLRGKFGGNSIVASIVVRYALGIGYPAPRVNTPDTDYNDAKESFLELKFDRIGWGSYDDLEALFFRINAEIALTGECFLVKMGNGKVRIVAAELVGSKDGETVAGEIDGIVYGFEGQAKKYRIGKRIKGRVSYAKADSTLVDADNVWHLGRGSRAEELRPFPPLASAIKDIYDLTQISDAKVEAIKVAAAYSLMITKHTSPEVFAAIMADGDPAYVRDALAANYARSEIKEKGSVLYGEVGEDAKVLQPSIQAQDFDLFFFGMIGRISNTLGMPPEEAIAGYWRSNYSSSRADKLRWKQAIDSNRRMHRHWLNDLQGWQTNRGILSGEFTLPNPKGSTGRVIEWQWPHVPEIDEAKAASAQIALFQAGLSSKTESAARRGRYIDEVTREQVNDAYALVKAIKVKCGDNSEPTPEELIAAMPKGTDAAKALESLGKVDK